MEPIPVLTAGDFSLRLDPQDVSFQDLAERELRETPAIRDSALQALRRLIQDDKHFQFPFDGPDGDLILLRFLRPCKFYPDSAFKKMKNFFTFKCDHPDWVNDPLKDEDLHLIQQELLRIVSSRDQLGRLMVFAESGQNWKPSDCSVGDYIRSVILLMEGITISSSVQRTGIVLILDCGGMSWTHLKQFTPSIAMTILYYVQECLPLRLKEIHIINEAYIFSLIFAIFKPFMSSKLRKRIHFHGKERTLLKKQVGAKFLPKKLDGELETQDLGGTTLFKFLLYYKKYYENIMAIEYTKKIK